MELRTANIKYSLMHEDLWRDVVGYEGIYKVCKVGIVYSLISEKILKPGFTRATGYYSVVFWSNSKNHRTHYIHRITATAFIPNPENKRTVNHIWGNKLNNHIANLEWATSAENNRHAVAIGARKIKCTPELIHKILSEHIKGDKNFGAQALAKKYSLDKSTVHSILTKHKHNL